MNNGTSLADTARVLGVPAAELTLVSSRYDAAAGAGGYMLTDYTVATRDGTTYLCIVDAGQRQAAVHNRPVCRRQESHLSF